MSRIRARPWLRQKTAGGRVGSFRILPEHGGIAGSLVGLGFIRRYDDVYTLTRKGARWIGAEPLQELPA